MAKLTQFIKGRMARAYEINDQVILVGQNSVCDIRISIPGGPQQCTRFVPDSGRIRVEQLTESEPLLVNHTPVTSALLNHGDIIQVSKHTFFFSETATPTFNMPLPQSLQDNVFEKEQSSTSSTIDFDDLPSGCIQVMSGPHVGKVIPLQRSLTRLGLTGNKCALIAHRDDGYFLSHLEGEAYPLVNNKAIGDKTIPLTDGAIIQIGNIKVRFHNDVRQSAAS